jgi:alpha-galactosidase
MSCLSFTPPARTASAVEELPPGQDESGLILRRELDVAQRWLDTTTERKAEWLDDWLGTRLPFSFKIGGQSSSELLQKWTSQATTAAGGERVYTWRDPDSGLQVQWKIKAVPDFPAVEWLLLFDNTGTQDSPLVSEVESLDLTLNRRANGDYQLHGALGGRSLPDDMVPFTWRLPGTDGRTTSVELGNDYPSSNRHLPFFNIQTPDNHGVMIGIGWSGHWAAQAHLNKTKLETKAGLNRSEFVLHPKESIRTPRVLEMFWEGKRLHAQNMFRQLLDQRYLPKLPDHLEHPMVSVNVCFTYHGHGGFLHQATSDTILPLVQPFADLGAELMIIDAGWYDGQPWGEWLGNWRYSKEKYPQGMRPIADALQQHNMRFGLWFASEAISKHAPVLESNPDFVRRADSQSGGTLRMDLPGARQWFLDQVNYLIDQQGMNCYRQDGAGGFGKDPPQRVGIAESEHMAGLYQNWDDLIAQHPALIREGCCGGGRRIDLETLSRFHWHQKSDRWYDSESDQCSLYGANLFLPGGIINIPTERTDNYGAWSSFAGQFCLGWHPLDKDFPMTEAREQVRRYKEIRPLLHGDFYPLTPCSLQEEWIGYQFHRADLDKGFVLLFRRKVEPGVLPKQSSFTAVLRGLNPQTTYRFHSEAEDRQGTVSGATGANHVQLEVPQAPGARLLLYERQ